MMAAVCGKRTREAKERRRRPQGNNTQVMKSTMEALTAASAALPSHRPPPPSLSMVPVTSVHAQHLVTKVAAHLFWLSAGVEESFLSAEVLRHKSR